MRGGLIFDKRSGFTRLVLQQAIILEIKREISKILTEYSVDVNNSRNTEEEEMRMLRQSILCWTVILAASSPHLPQRGLRSFSEK